MLYQYKISVYEDLQNPPWITSFFT